MTRILVTADHHIGNHGRFGGPARGGINTRARLALAATRSAHALARKLGCSAHLVCGDLFHSSRPSPPLLAAVQRTFAPDPRAIVLLGNHDYHSVEPYDHALSPLEPVVELVTGPRIIELDGLEIWAVPFTVCTGRRAAEQLAEQLEALSQARGAEQPVPMFPGSERSARALAIHMGIGDGQTSEVLRATAGWAEADDLRELAQRFGFSWVFAGDWHDPRVWFDSGKIEMRAERTDTALEISAGVSGRVTIVQCGTLCPVGFGDDGFDRGRAWLLDTATGRVEPHTVPGPRFVRAASVDELELPDDAGLVFVEITTTMEHLAAERAALAELVKAKAIEAGHVRVSKSEISQATQRAASRARDAGSIQDAARAWVDGMPLDAGVSRERVRERVVGYLRI